MPSLFYAKVMGQVGAAELSPSRVKAAGFAVASFVKWYGLNYFEAPRLAWVGQVVGAVWLAASQLPEGAPFDGYDETREIADMLSIRDALIGALYLDGEIKDRKGRISHERAAGTWESARVKIVYDGSVDYRMESGEDFASPVDVETEVLEKLDSLAALAFNATPSGSSLYRAWVEADENFRQFTRDNPNYRTAQSAANYAKKIYTERAQAWLQGFYTRN